MRVLIHRLKAKGYGVLKSETSIGDFPKSFIVSGEHTREEIEEDFFGIVKGILGSQWYVSGDAYLEITEP